MNSLPPRPAAATRRGFVLRSFHMQIESDGKTFVTGYNVQPSSFVSLLLCRTRSRRVPPRPLLPSNSFPLCFATLWCRLLKQKRFRKLKSYRVIKYGARGRVRIRRGNDSQQQQPQHVNIAWKWVLMNLSPPYLCASGCAPSGGTTCRKLCRIRQTCTGVV